MVLHGSNQLNYNVEFKKTFSPKMYICIYSPHVVLRYRNRDRCMKKSNMDDDISCWIQSVLYKKMQGGFLQIIS